ncbi:MAG: serine hydrolase [Synechococcaceae cyanobacterium SM2_3_60]|nr:serine hydrolase [Synechococcaceae cyanobacterium SM2_3_60]
MLQDQLDLAIATLLHRHPDLAAETLAVTVIDRATGEEAAHQGDQLCYPASVVKLFYLAATYAWVEAGKLEATTELEAARQAMIQASSNDATAYIVDLLTDTTSGPELAASEFALWQQKRLVVNTYFQQQGYSAINCCQKTWSDAPYGRDRQSYAQSRRNALSTHATARLWQRIIEGNCVSPAASAAMLPILQRDLDPPATATTQIIKCRAFWVRICARRSPSIPRQAKPVFVGMTAPTFAIAISSLPLVVVRPMFKISAGCPNSVNTGQP